MAGRTRSVCEVNRVVRRSAAETHRSGVYRISYATIGILCIHAGARWVNWFAKILIGWSIYAI